MIYSYPTKVVHSMTNGTCMNVEKCCKKTQERVGRKLDNCKNRKCKDFPAHKDMWHCVYLRWTGIRRKKEQDTLNLIRPSKVDMLCLDS